MTFSSIPSLVSCALMAGLVAMTPARAADSKDFSAAEQALFVDNHLVKVKPPLTLHFDFRKSGSLEESFNDKIDVALGAQSDGACCTSSASFMTGTHKVPQPEVDGAKANPAILYFLERDIQEMERLTKGKANYFRKRIRMAVFQGAVIRDVTLPYRGKPVAVREISIAPYLDDPNRPRYERLANKRYVFLLASDVPGGLYGIRTRIDGASADAPPLMEEEMLLAGTDTAPVKRQP